MSNGLRIERSCRNDGMIKHWNRYQICDEEGKEKKRSRAGTSSDIDKDSSLLLNDVCVIITASCLLYSVMAIKLYYINARLKNNF